MSDVSFIKMHGLGNDFVIIDRRQQTLALDPALVRRITDRHRGVGGDMLITMEAPRNARAAVFMGIYNADGGEVDACGNANRCIARLLMEETGKPQTVIQTNAGLLACWAAPGGLITVDMGAPKFEWQDIPLEERMDTRGIDIKIGPIDNPVLAFPSAVNVGNPHCVFFVPDVGAHDPERIGPLVENHLLFPERANVGFAQIRARNDIRLRVWERGVGVTQACGTAACAAVAAAARKGKNLADRKVRVELDGGVLDIDWREADDHIYMTGPAALSYRGLLAPEFSGHAMSETQIINFGCRLNQYEAEVMRMRARQAGLQNAIIINSCAVTAEATRQARQAVRKARRDHADARIIVTGCAAQIEPHRFADMPEVDLVLGNMEKLEAASYAAHATRNDFGAHDSERVRVNDIMSVRETAGHLIEGLEGRARAFVQIQNGCDHRCTFCIIPFGRGKSRSVPAGEVVDQVRRLAANGYREVVLTGVDITSYGGDLPGRTTLGRLVLQILKHVPELARLRLSSLDVIELDEDLLVAIATQARLMPHLHLSLQAGDDLILKRMKRRHLRADAIALCDRLRALRPGIVLGADLIAGFPTETDAMFENSLGLIDACGLAYLHVFPYSAREGTPAARMPQTPGAVRKLRAARLRAAGALALQNHLRSLVGTRAMLLMETEFRGRTECYAEVDLVQACEPGSLQMAELSAVQGERLAGIGVAG